MKANTQKNSLMSYGFHALFSDLLAMTVYLVTQTIIKYVFSVIKTALRYSNKFI